MYLDELGHNINLNKILNDLETIHGIRLKMKADGPGIRECYASYSAIKTKILLESPYNSYQNNPEYAKASLICEAIRIFLSEISPARKGAKIRTKKMQKIKERKLTNVLSKLKEKREWSKDADAETRNTLLKEAAMIYGADVLEESKLIETDNGKEIEDIKQYKLLNFINEHYQSQDLINESITYFQEYVDLQKEVLSIKEDIYNPDIAKLLDTYKHNINNPEYVVYFAFEILPKGNKLIAQKDKYSHNSDFSKNKTTDVLYFANINDMNSALVDIRLSLDNNTTFELHDLDLTETDAKKEAHYYLDRLNNIIAECKKQNIPLPEDNLSEIYEVFKISGNFLDEDIEDENIESVIKQYKGQAHNSTHIVYIVYIVPLRQIELELNLIKRNKSIPSKNKHTQSVEFDSYNDACDFMVNMKISLEGDYTINCTDKISKSNITETDDGKEIQPEDEIGDNMWTDAPQDFDGEDQTNGYADDRDPNGDHGYDNFDYDAVDTWSADAFILEPEIGDTDEDTELKPQDSEYSEQNVVDRYESGPGPVSGDYADDRNPEYFKQQDGERTVEDPNTLLAKNVATTGTETKIGLPAELEKGIEANYVSGTKKNGVNDNTFNQSPEKSPQRDIPKPNDLQNDNNKYYNGGEQQKATKATNPLKGNTETPAETQTEKPKETPETDFKVNDDSRPKTNEQRILALGMINEFNNPNKVNSLSDAIKNVTKKANVKESVVLEAYKIVGRKYLAEYSDRMKDPDYQKAMLASLDIIESPKLRPMLKTAQDTYDSSNLLREFLINKAKAMGFVGNSAKKFVYAVHHTLLNADLKGFRPGRPVWERKNG